MARTLMSLRRGGKRLTTEQGVVPHFGLGEGVEMAPIRCAETSASREKQNGGTQSNQAVNGPGWKSLEPRPPDPSPAYP